ncbi:probable ATP-dependent RNA helicase DHX37 isoform X2 [Corticium candelabrum]|uniref:probable ATP-dependent RNA helicase DHX37 isoform X2 n=1 Tax=Corticium candelabrum TaxID=121492 RepID=UPI002E275D08|nr:probable ATP-dependent RNA helicase DHX37 isoform X2 [Corticium candelabrum]
MGKKRQFNRKARLQATHTSRQSAVDILDQSVTKDVVQGDILEEKYGAGALGNSNEFALMPRSRETRVHAEIRRNKLTQKQRRRLQRIVEAKEKKAKRARLLESLSQHAISPQESLLLKPTVSIANAKETRRGLERRMEVEQLSSKLDIEVKSRKSRKRKQTESCLVAKEIHKVMKTKIESSSSNESSYGDDEDHNEDEDDNDAVNDDNNSSGKDMKTAELGQTATQTVSAAVKYDKLSKESENMMITSDENTFECQHNLQSCRVTSEREPQSAVVVALNRDPQIQMVRLQLPIVAEEQAIMEAIYYNSVVIICGETGSGKTTQVPQFLYEAGYGSKESPGVRAGVIGVTEPRRVAAVSMSKRVAQEMALPTSVVSYQIRYEGNVTEKTAIKFMTDGVLLREVEQDFLLSKYSVIIIDEAHERSVFTDIMIGLLSRIVPLREKKEMPLKLVIMSATLKIDEFTENKLLFPTAPVVINVESRQYSVTVHFNRRTPNDYVNESFRKVCKIHRTLPAGGILVFVTGQREVEHLCRKLRRQFPSKFGQTSATAISRKMKHKKRHVKRSIVKVNLDDYSTEPTIPLRPDSLDDGEIADVECSSESEESDNGLLEGDGDLPLHVLPLYSLLPSDKQAKVFKVPPTGYRLCVIATNVAETSITIPHVKYVVDSGMVKQKVYDNVTGISTFRVTWTSKASANQRAGRAGRTDAGHCYRLFSSSVFQHHFPEFARAEISGRPVDDLILQMKSMGITVVENFPFPTPPKDEAIKAAEQLLVNLGALKEEKTSSGSVQRIVTSLGLVMAKFPVSPRCAKMLTLGHQNGCLPYIIALVAALSVKELFMDSNLPTSTSADMSEEQHQERQYSLRKRWAGQGGAELLGDLMVLLRAVGACEYSGNSEKFCSENGIRYKAMSEVRRLRLQLTNAVNGVVESSFLCVNPKMVPPSLEQARILRQIVLAGCSDHVARRIPVDTVNERGIKKAQIGYECLLTDDVVFIHPTTVLFRLKPDFVVFQELFETSKLYMRNLCAVEPDWLSVLSPHLCSYSKPLEQPPPDYDTQTGTVKCYMTSTFV